MHNVTVKCIHAFTVAAVKQEPLHIPKVLVCSLRYPAWNEHVPYCHSWRLMLYYIFHIISQMAQFSKKS